MKNHKYMTPNEEIDLYIRHKDMEIKYGKHENLINLLGGRFISVEGGDSIYVFNVNRDKCDKLSKTYADRLLIKGNQYKFEFLNLEKNQLQLKVIEFKEDISKETSTLEVDLVEDNLFVIKRERSALEQLRDATDPSSIHKKNFLFGNETPKKALKKACSFEINTLNPEQKDAVRYAIGVNDLYLIWGPPGTGKTHIIPEIVSNYIGLQKGSLFGATQKILICSYQNTAVDNVIRKLFKKFRSDIVRFGPSTLGEKFKEVFLYEQVKQKKSQIEEEYNGEITAREEKIKGIKERLGRGREYRGQHRITIKKLTEKEDILQENLQGIKAKKGDIIKKIELIDVLIKRYPTNTISRLLYKFKLREQVIKITAEDGITSDFELHKLDYAEFKSLHKQLLDHQDYIELIEHDLGTKLKDIIKQREIILSELDDEAKDIDLLNNLNTILNKSKNEKRNRLDAVIQDILNKKTIIITTNLRASSKIFDGIPFGLVIMDESGAVDLPGAIIPILNGDKIIFLGDHKQLPPVVSDRHPEIKNLLEKHPEIRWSVFKRLYEPDKDYDNARQIMLKKQYRMKGDIADFISRSFYDEKLETPENIKGVLHEEGDDIISSKHSLVCFLRKFGTHKQERGSSLYSPGEIRLIKKIIEHFENQYGNEILDKIAVITPYRAQNERIKKELPTIDCGTVHRFQGQEKEIIIYGTTRYSPTQSYGFGPLLQQVSLLNVAISRTKEKFIIIGSEKLFKDVRAYKELYDYTEKHGYIVKNQLGDYDSINACKSCNNMISPEKEYCYECAILKKMQDMQSDIPREVKTEDNHLVRSIHEALIDNWLSRHNIPHEVEKKIPIKQLRYCDWYLPDYDVYIEYWGMMSNPSYTQSRKIKERLYEKNGLKLLGLEEKDAKNLDEIIRFKLEKFGVTIE